ncbi:MULTISPECIES: hypothetical protein [Francisella]|uniref:hypothetical protein n=1 Tax=Francisella TaxID=262 RepID=UPI00090ADC78|nr:MULTISPECIES: hypothetical protein [Francisella]APC92139.1 hypothetical protein BBG19_1411 [Francisella sp. MA067296]
MAILYIVNDYSAVTKNISESGANIIKANAENADPSKLSIKEAEQDDKLCSSY